MNVSTNNNNYGQVALTASLSKKQQLEQGQTELKLLQSATESAPQSEKSTATSPSQTVGAHINIKV